MSATVPMHSSVMRVVLQAKHLPTDRCDKPLVYQDKVLLTHSCRLLGINPQPLATMPLPSTALKVRVFLRAWLSMQLPTAMHTTVQIVTATVTLNRRTDRTLKCTNRDIRYLPSTSARCGRNPNISITETERSWLHLIRLLPFFPSLRKLTSLNDFHSWGYLHSCRGCMCWF
jgi:hypothetical protein